MSTATSTHPAPKVCTSKDGIVTVNGEVAGRIERALVVSTKRNGTLRHTITFRAYGAKGNYLTTQYAKRIAVDYVVSIGR